jgi:hypothetical protein
MENLPVEQFEFWPVTLRRPMKLFKGALSQSKSFGEPFVPDLDFLVRLITDYRSHQAMFRESAGDHFKSFENHIRSKHQVSSVSMMAMSQKLGVTPDDISKLAHGKKDGHLVPEFLRIFSLVEEIPYKFTAHTLDTEVICPCCKKNILDDRDAFWLEQSVAFNKPEYAFADRMLSAAVGASFIMMKFIGNSTDWQEIYTLAQRSKYPIGNWLLDIQKSYGVTSLAELAVKMQMMCSPECHVPHERLKKWSAGMDMMPMSVAKALSQQSGRYGWHWGSFILVRTLAFTIDFLVAAAPGRQPRRQIIQEIIEDRFVGLFHNMHVALAKRAKDAKETR